MTAISKRVLNMTRKRFPVISSPEIFAWCMYDFGAAAFVTSVLTVFYGPFITTLAHNAAQGGQYVSLFGLPITPGAYYPYLISFSVLLQILFLPAIGALADRLRIRKLLLIIAAALGSACLLSILALGDSDIIAAGALFLIANIAFGASDVLYNAFLPDICPAEKRNKVSSTGWAFGYLGGGILLIIQYIFLGNISEWGFSDIQAVRIALASCGLWWGLIAIFTIRNLRSDQATAVGSVKRPPRLSTFAQLRETLKGMKRYPQTLLFLAAFLLYSDGIQTLTSVSTQFGQEEIGLSIEQLAEVILIVQFVGVLGAVLFNALANWFGTKGAIMTALSMYIALMIYAYAWLSNATEFYIMAAVMSLILVGSQALSRAAFSKMIPAGMEAEYFGIYEISERGTSWLGPLFFGLALQFTGSYRIAILCLVVYFVVGAVLLAKVKFAQAEREVSETDRTKLKPVNHQEPVSSTTLG